MCTVTYIPSKEGCFLTSNRDEKITRANAVEPGLYIHNDITMLYPRDGAAGGTWITVCENGNGAVLLNGAFKKHISSPPYRESRGLIFIEIMASSNPYVHFLQTSLYNIEPFTLVLYCNNELYECVWDGTVRHHQLLNKQLPHIWSSSTLYAESIIEKRQQWFFAWLESNAVPLQNDILRFHRFAGDGDSENNVVMSRDNVLRTVSITGIECTAAQATVKHYDLLNDKASESCISFITKKMLHVSEY